MLTTFLANVKSSVKKNIPETKEKRE